MKEKKEGIEEGRERAERQRERWTTKVQVWPVMAGLGTPGSQKPHLGPGAGCPGLWPLADAVGPQAGSAGLLWGPRVGH